jgi:hypothetical protein
MGLFDKLRGKNSDKAGNKDERLQKPSYFFNWLSRDLGIALIRQKEFGRLIGDSPTWQADLAQGIISFDGREFPAAFLGSESYSSNTWLWGWVNVNDYPEPIYKDSEIFYQHCMMQQMSELKEPELPLTELINGHTLASMAVVANEERICYYKAPYNGGAAFLLVKNIPEEVFEPVSAPLAALAISEAIAGVPIHHEKLVEGVMDAYASEIQKDQSVIIGKFPDAGMLVIEFDEQGRIKNIRSK